jgi:acyl-CoA synthetase (AMP-forming)/AMP-acid ligase II
MNANLYALLRSHFAEHLEQPCVLIPGGPVIHYDDLDAAAARIAHALVAAGCIIGDRVAVQTDKCWQVLAVYLGIAKPSSPISLAMPNPASSCALPPTPPTSPRCAPARRC